MPSFSKILVLAIIVAAVWYGAKALLRWQARQEANSGRRQKPKSSGKGDVEDMKPCTVCGVYFSSGRTEGCDRGDCPHR